MKTAKELSSVAFQKLNLIEFLIDSPILEILFEGGVIFWKGKEFEQGGLDINLETFMNDWNLLHFFSIEILWNFFRTYLSSLISIQFFAVNAQFREFAKRNRINHSTSNIADSFFCKT